MNRFPFGASVEPCGTATPDRHYPVVLVGAYPSALHVRWTPPPGHGRAVSALPVDNEPQPFWAPSPEEVATLFKNWRARHFQKRWGSVAPARLNGPSGAPIESDYLRPMGYTRADTFITDCLTTARASTGVAQRLADRYQRVVDELGAPPASLDVHPSESEIVSEALREHAPRITRQIEAAEPDVIVTLGNAAARVVGAVGGYSSRATLRPDDYGHDRHVTIGDTEYCWVALVHPAVRPPWIERHRSWAAAQAGN